MLQELGSELPEAMIRATAAARADLEQLRSDPRRFMLRNERDLANSLHFAYWVAICDEMAGRPGVQIRDSEPYRELTVSTATGRSYVARIKRHSIHDRLTSYETAADRDFWGGGVQTLDGMELVKGLAIGYRWDRDLREIVEPVISYREGKRNVVWAYEIDPTQESTLPLGYRDITPGLPKVDLRDAALADEEEGLAGSE
ncbi:hypothetical protein [Sanguibacter sp. HDW7]|uniref:hypothetical protein n=1 Tax=Sanguibacter sp. HDW7 TaxID=2714931 RepID=UPI00140E3E6C|nr:hypothetical protein [Sanguibacter sp. HDW7]QIK82976.1 hypothetical protein G7063_04555 [Sanguibacter sp. HDW7]